MKQQFFKGMNVVVDAHTINLITELTLLGFFSMALFLITHGVSVGKNTKYVFEFVHFALFFMLLFELVLVIVLAGVSSRIFVQWEYLETHKGTKFHCHIIVLSLK